MKADEIDILDLLAEGVTWDELLARDLISDSQYTMAMRNMQEDSGRKTKQRVKPPAPTVPQQVVAPRPVVVESPKLAGVQLRYMLATCRCCGVTLILLSQTMAKFTKRNLVEYKPFTVWTDELAAAAMLCTETVNIPLDIEACLVCVETENWRKR